MTIQFVKIGAEVREHGYADGADYVAQLIREDQKRQANDRLEAMVLASVEESGEIELTPEAWLDSRMELRKQAGLGNDGAAMDLEALVLEGMESGDPVEMTAEKWEEMRLDFHRLAGS
jgi:antitoxin ParD1/3/4